MLKKGLFFQLLMPKVNGKDIFFSSNFDFLTWVIKFLKHYERYLKKSKVGALSQG